jgi:hypothetical protein
LVTAGVMSGLRLWCGQEQASIAPRFVETWIRFRVPTNPTAARLSLPLLRHTLFGGHEADADALEQMRPGVLDGGCARIVTGDEVDGDEGEPRERRVRVAPRGREERL